MPTRNPDPTGELCLKDYWHESASGHSEKSHKAVLVPNGNKTVVLVEMHEHSNTFNMSDESSSQRWAIGVDELIQLIRTHGTKVN